MSHLNLLTFILTWRVNVILYYQEKQMPICTNHVYILQYHIYMQRKTCTDPAEVFCCWTGSFPRDAKALSIPHVDIGNTWEFCKSKRHMPLYQLFIWATGWIYRTLQWLCFGRRNNGVLQWLCFAMILPTVGVLYVYVMALLCPCRTVLHIVLQQIGREVRVLEISQESWLL